MKYFIGKISTSVSKEVTSQVKRPIFARIMSAQQEYDRLYALKLPDLKDRLKAFAAAYAPKLNISKYTTKPKIAAVLSGMDRDYELKGGPRTPSAKVAVTATAPPSGAAFMGFGAAGSPQTTAFNQLKSELKASDAKQDVNAYVLYVSGTTDREKQWESITVPVEINGVTGDGSVSIKLLGDINIPNMPAIKAGLSTTVPLDESTGKIDTVANKYNFSWLADLKQTVEAKIVIPVSEVKQNAQLAMQNLGIVEKQPEVKNLFTGGTPIFGAPIQTAGPTINPFVAVNRDAGVIPAAKINEMLIASRDFYEALRAYTGPQNAVTSEALTKSLFSIEKIAQYMFPIVKQL